MVVFFALLFLAYFFLRGYLLQQAFQSAQQRLKSRGLTMEVGEIEFAGFSGVYCKDLVIYPDHREPLVMADSVYLRPRLFPLLRKEARIRDLAVVSGRLNLIHTDSVDNFMFLFGYRTDSTFNETPASLTDSLQSPHIAREHGKTANDLITAFFNNTPESTLLKNVRTRVVTTDTRLDVLIDNFNFSGNFYQAEARLQEDTLSYRCLSSGTIHPRDHSLNFLFYGAEGKKIYVPFIASRFNARVGFDSVRLNLRGKKYDSGVLNLVGKATFSGSAVQQEKISESEVRIDHASLLLDLNIGPSYAEIDSSSLFVLNAIPLKPYVKFSQLDSRRLTLQVQSQCKARDFFHSLPGGLFHTLQGIQATGYLRYNMKFDVDFSNPDDLLFTSSMDSYDFKIKDFGAVNFKKINGPFFHKVYVDDRLVESFVVGPQNPDYTPLVHISPYLVHAVINNEDGSFYDHAGFNERAFRESIALNIKKGAFVRGASTIPMQLVKNVFLSRDKTITRKLEEIIIVWLIENLDLVSKRRMLEVYFNVIEFGPNIYGVSNGTHFYFNKAPSQLTLAEALFMASIVPRPRLFRYAFSQSGQLLPSYEYYFNRLTNIMLRRGQIEPEDTVMLKDSVYLAGPAAKWFENYDPYLADSMIITLDPIFQ